MALDPSSVTFTGEEVRQVSEFIHDKKYVDWGKIDVGIEPNAITARKQIVHWGDFPDIGRNAGGCNQTLSTATLSPTEEYWDPNPISDRIPFCLSAVEDTMFTYLREQGVNNLKDPKAAALMFLIMKISEAVPNIIMREGWLGDTAIGATFPPLPNATNQTLFNHVDGLWKQLEAIGGNASYSLTGDPNAGASYTAQLNYNGDDVQGWLDGMLAQADQKMKDPSTYSFGVTNWIMDKIVTMYGDKTANTYSRNWVQVSDGATGQPRSFRYQGYLIEEKPFLTRTISTYFNNGTVWHKPNRIVFADFKNNLRFGLDTPLYPGYDSAGRLTSIPNWNLDVEYIPGEQNWNVFVGFKMDAKVIRKLDYVMIGD